MLDANLLTFFIADAKDGTKHHSTFYQTRGGSEPEPAYTLRHADPESANSRNCYAAALFDSYIDDVLFGEVLLQPGWTQPTLSQEEIRRNGGVPPPPEPIMPTDFTIQLYNPDQQIQVTHKVSALLGTLKWEFSMPQDTFRAPSSSMLDKSQHDPGATTTTPRINFVWKRETKFSKDLTCYVTGKSTDLQGKKKYKEPDIAIALLKHLKELTIYEPNLYRVDMEDPKGLEVVLLLSAAVIRDVFFGNIKQAFNVYDATRKTSSTSINTSPSGAAANTTIQPTHPQPLSNGSPLGHKPPTQPPRPSAAPPITDPRTQWEIDAETARLKAHADAEARDQRRQQEIERKARERTDAEEARRLKRVFEQEEKDRKAKQKQIDKETERLKKIYGNQQPPGSAAASTASPQSRPGPIPHQIFYPQQQQQQQQQQFSHPPMNYQGYQAPPQPHAQSYPQPVNLPPPGPSYYYSGPPAQASQSLQQQQQQPPPDARPRRSFLNLRSLDEASNRLSKKTSSVW